MTNLNGAYLTKTVLTLGCWLSMTTLMTQPGVCKEVELEVGIVQRFGENPEQTLTIAAVKDDTLTLELGTTQQQQLSLEAQQVTLEIAPSPLPDLKMSERLVLGNHATFETAEDDAQKWQARGIAVEIAQPERWQVWAKRDIYSTPLLRRLLLLNLQAQGYQEPYLETAILTAKPQVSVVVGEDIYQTTELSITSAQDLFRVSVGEKRPNLYSGSLQVQPNAYGNFTLVNAVPLEIYLRGVVPYEIGKAAPTEAIKAQTIIARTYALRNLRRFQVDNYQLCATVHCQVYKGIANTDIKVNRAIAATRGLVLTYDNELVDALYSSTTGGVTASFSDIWNGLERPYLKSLIDSPTKLWDLSRYPLSQEESFRRFINLQKGFNETGRRPFRWRKESSLEDLTADVQKYLTKINHPLADFNTIEKIEILQRSPSGRILNMEVTTDQGVITLQKTEVRSALGPPRSTLFYLDPLYDEEQNLNGYAFVGGGFGHGVGLSQYGSYNLARLGWSAKRILSFYYPGTVVRPLNEDIIFWSQSSEVGSRKSEVNHW